MEESGASGVSEVELSGLRAVDERGPLTRGEEVDGPAGVLGVTDGTAAVGRLGDLDALGLAVAVAALDEDEVLVTLHG
jgi:hypothetical protein